MPQIKWFERTFAFNTSENIFPSIIERLRGTPARLEERIKQFPPSILTIRHDDNWSIAENIGHLIDLEPLWQGRLDDFIRSEELLRPADLQNTKTHNANHNLKPIDELLLSFRNVRSVTINSIESLSQEVMDRTALHPRLRTPMRIIDHFLFVAEHDDHHLATMTELARQLSK